MRISRKSYLTDLKECEWTTQQISGTILKKSN